MESNKTYKQLESELSELRFQLEEANDTIEAIRTGKVDAVVVLNENGHQLYTLKNADQTYRVFIEKMNEGAVTLNNEGIIIYSNTTFCQSLKMPGQKVTGQPFISFVAENEKELFKSVFKESWKKDRRIEIHLESSDQSRLPCHLSFTTLELDEGLCMSIILTDLSQQKAAQEELRAKNRQLEEAQQASILLNNKLEDTVNERTKELLLSREHFKLMANNIPQMTWTNLPNGEVNFFNKRWYEYTGLTEKDTKSWGWQKIIHPDDLRITMEKFLEALKTETAFEVENRYRKADDTYQWHLSRSLPFRNEAGKVLFWVGTATNIEEQKKALEKKDEFIGIASHELKTPLTSLKGYLQLIETFKKEEVPPQIKEFAGKANSALGKLQYLVNDLLNVTKIQAGKLQFAKTDINLSELLESWVENANHIYETFTIYNDTSEQLFVNGNPERLEQVVMNLINNSVKYACEEKSIRIKAEKLDGHAQVSVKDYGIGLSSDQIERVFERFYRANDNNYSASGLGMGLYISAEIVKSHDGSMRVESELNKGSTFYFTIPLAENPE
nr:ATP-binding protein [Pedobacter xinjiangensis]